LGGSIKSRKRGENCNVVTRNTGFGVRLDDKSSRCRRGESNIQTKEAAVGPNWKRGCQNVLEKVGKGKLLNLGTAAIGGGEGQIILKPKRLDGGGGDLSWREEKKISRRIDGVK